MKWILRNLWTLSVELTGYSRLTLWIEERYIQELMRRFERGRKLPAETTGSSRSQKRRGGWGC